MTAADRVKTFLDVRDDRERWGVKDVVIAWVVDETHEEHQLTDTDLRDLLAENARLSTPQHRRLR